MRTATSCTALLALLTLAGCPGTLEDPQRFQSRDAGTRDGGARDAGDGDASVEAAAASLLRARCGDDACHGGAAPMAGLDLVASGAGARMRNVPAASCAGRLIFDPLAPGESFLLEKIDDAALPACGARMPMGAPALSEAERALLGAWLETL